MATDKLHSGTIKNIAQIEYNGLPAVKTCPQTTIVNPKLKVVKRAFTCQDGMITSDDAYDESTAGGVGNDRTITYELLLINAGKEPFTKLNIKDTIGIKNTDFTIVSSNQTTLPTTKVNTLDPNKTDIIFTQIDSVDAPSVQSITYTIQLSKDLDTNNIFSNKAAVKYTENPNDLIDNPDFDSRKPISPDNPEKIPTPEESDPVFIALKDSKVNTWKTAPDSVICSEAFSYEIFVQSINKEVNDITITDILQKEFNMGAVVVEKGTYDELAGEFTSTQVLNENTDYMKTPASSTTGSATTLVISKPDSSTPGATNNLDLAANETLRVTINGKYVCTPPSPPTP